MRPTASKRRSKPVLGGGSEVEAFDPTTQQDFLRALAAIEKEAQRDDDGAVQIRDIVPIANWVDSDYFIGPDVRNIYPFWKSRLIDIFEKPYAVNEVIVDGSIGSGKTTFSELVLMRRLYELSCWSNVPALFNMMSKSVLVFLYFSVSMQQAERTGFGELRSLIDASPYFKLEFPRKQDVSSVLVWPAEHLLIACGSRTSHAIGTNMIGSILDEANFYGDRPAHAQDLSRVAELYASIVHRSQSRFMQYGRDASLSVLVSSSTHSNSFTEGRKKAAKGSSKTLVIETCLWKVKPKGTYSTKCFYVFTGSDLLDPFLVEDATAVNQFLSSQGLQSVPPELPVKRAVAKVPGEYQPLFVPVPVDFKHSFEVDLISGLQDIAGISVAPMGKLFTARPVYIQATKLAEGQGIAHPFTRQEFVISTGDNIGVQDFLKPHFQFRDREKQRFIHIDQSLSSDDTGVACCYVSHVLEENGIRKPVIAFDFLLRICPPRPPRQISIAKVRDFVLTLPANYGIKLGYVTTDTFGSQETQQVFVEQGIPGGFQSVDRTDAQYRTMVNLFFEGRLIMYRYAPFEEELFELVHDRARRKVDHAPGGKKDVSDAVVGAINNALESADAGHGRGEDVLTFVEFNESLGAAKDPFSYEELAGEGYIAASDLDLLV